MKDGEPNIERIKFDRHVRDYSANFSGGRARVELRTDGQRWAWFHSRGSGGFRITEPRATEAEAVRDLNDIVIACGNCTAPGDSAQWSKA